ncbi:MAG: hypothetical protein DLM67_22800 [Candidatus Nephthysia bennettiae]|uniref:Major facilitator superfamily (MFS) profile domain-containing protein n=2 Tax=Candidatus Nephthysia bennettiae TaxID=3127016 RepID=A0A934JZQ8_9BACT|nr:hypothetical protein [Candidatus Dormibacteraeota bacterium]MBJ7612430.1 hypothetical protein [Candidatus Dormibacteraeota bacterium]PZR87102.1 MAG: hypothetical protein DLM67_22800 [Candidatus Dormibacteraeota bacterium]
MRSCATSAGSSMNWAASFIAPLAVGALLGAFQGIASIFGTFGIVAIAGLLIMVLLGIETRQRVLEGLSVLSSRSRFATLWKQEQFVLGKGLPWSISTGTRPSVPTGSEASGLPPRAGRSTLSTSRF